VSGAAGDVRHLYVHLPFCASRCGYCDFVTVVERQGQHGAYVDALLAELALERDALAPRLESVFLGGGTPTLTERRELARLLRALPPAEEVTVEANPETVTPALARFLRNCGVTRVSLGAQSFQPRLLSVLERRAGPDDVRRAVYALRDAKFDNISLDLIYGIPGQSAADLDADLSEALALEPEHLSCYELEAKPGTRFTHTHGAELSRQAEAMESYFERVVARLTEAGYRWYETATGAAGPTSVSGSAPFRQSTVGAGARRRGSGVTSRRCARGSGRSGKSRCCRSGSGARSRFCWACAWTSRCRSQAWRTRSTGTRSSGSNSSAWSGAPKPARRSR
jgi:coproporphyrinogen III oxidase-like Fe-S oxidoreductase